MKVEITIDVDDLDLAVEFYCHGLGLELVRRTREWARAELNGQTFWIFAFPAGSQGAITRSYSRHWTPIHLDFIVSDLDEVLRRALAAAGRLDRPVRRDELEPLGRCDVANLSDPAGNRVDLIQRHLQPSTT